MPRGGYQEPAAKRSAPSGPGRFSKRDEKNQPIREVDIDDPGMEYGDRTRMRDSQRAQPIRNGQSVPSGGRTPARMTGQPASGASLPPWLFDQPSTRPGEPATAGLDMGPGPGHEALMQRELAPDLREQTLEYLAINFRTESAIRMLQDYRNQRAEQQGAQAMMPAANPLQPDMGAEPTPPEEMA